MTTCNRLSVFETFHAGSLLKTIKDFKLNDAKVIIDFQRSDQADVLAKYLKVPVITMSLQSKPREDYIISMYPSITVINVAIVEFLLRYQVEDALLLYDRKCRVIS